MLKNKEMIIGRSYKYLNTAVLIPLIRINKETHLLFEQRSSDIVQGDEICFPGGRFDVEKDATLKDTAQRETCEELGITKNRVKVRQKFGILITPIGVLVEAYTAIIRIKSIRELNINKAEVRRVFTIPLDWFRKNPPREHQLHIEVRPFRYNDNHEKEHLLPVKDYALPERYEQPWEGREHTVFVYPAPSGVIWGITAEIIREYIKRK
ncbi:MAG: CoA pyrophosphatase [Candidatus Marinimicrobia bacterium]|nr:CoA pyrophosphatase [Candidatus Neomarinimicrobiota bacterium]